MFACFGFFPCVVTVFFGRVIAKLVMQFFALLHFDIFHPVCICVHMIVCFFACLFFLCLGI